MKQHALLILLALSAGAHAGTYGSYASMSGLGPTGRALYGGGEAGGASGGVYGQAANSTYSGIRTTPDQIKMYTRGGVNAGIGERYSAVGSKAAARNAPPDLDQMPTSKSQSRSLSHSAGGAQRRSPGDSSGQ